MQALHFLHFHLWGLAAFQEQCKTISPRLLMFCYVNICLIFEPVHFQGFVFLRAVYGKVSFYALIVEYKNGLNRFQKVYDKMATFILGL